MTDAIKSTLDSCAAFAKDHHVLVQSFELLVASVSLLSMIPCLIVIAKTGTLHWNCKWARNLVNEQWVHQLQTASHELGNCSNADNHGSDRKCCLWILHRSSSARWHEWEYKYWYDVVYKIFRRDILHHVHSRNRIRHIHYCLCISCSGKVRHKNSFLTSCNHCILKRFVALWNATTYSGSIASWSSIIFMALFAVRLFCPYCYTFCSDWLRCSLGILFWYWLSAVSISLQIIYFRRSFLHRNRDYSVYRASNECGDYLEMLFSRTLIVEWSTSNMLIFNSSFRLFFTCIVGRSTEVWMSVHCLLGIK